MLIYYKDFDWSKLLLEKPVKRKKQMFSNNIYGFDIEVTTAFEYKGKIYSKNEIDKLKLDDKEKKNVKPVAWEYIWQFGIDDNFVKGRTWDDLDDFCRILNEHDKNKKIVYIENYSYEFQFLRNIDVENDPFARKARKVIKSVSEKYNIEFRCLYFLTNLGLAKIPKFYNNPTQKLVENLNYDLIRTPETVLSQEEEDYCENDVKIIYEAILKERETYGNVYDIPLTSTGKVRKELRERIGRKIDHYKLVSKASELTFEGFKRIVKCYRGGFTHANMINSHVTFIKGLNCDGVAHDDFGSSYPAVALYEKFAMQAFKPLKWKVKTIEGWNKLDHENYCYQVIATLKNVEAKTSISTISESQCDELELEEIELEYFIERDGQKKKKKEKRLNIDNGRVVKARRLKMTMCDVDFDILIKAYNFEIENLDIFYSFKTYLPRVIVDFILDLYEKKSTLKECDDDLKFLYERYKAWLNSVYGMMVSNLIQDQIIFEPLASDEKNEWLINALNEEQVTKELQRYYNFTKYDRDGTKKFDYEYDKHMSMFAYSWGVWISAYARRNLLEVALEMGDDFIYGDTDSHFFKISDRCFKIIEDFNVKVVDKIKKMCYIQDIDFERTRPFNERTGKHYQIGVLELEHSCLEKFRCLGAKKYIFELDGKLHLTCAGVKKSAVKEIKKIDDFECGFVFSAENSGNMIAYYNSNQEPFEVTDYQGHTSTISDKYSIALVKSSYEVSNSEDYGDLIELLAHYRENNSLDSIGTNILRF